MIKASLPFSLYFLVTLFNKVLQTQIYPEQWSRGIITPVPKSRETVNPDNYHNFLTEVRLSLHKKLETADLITFTEEVLY